MGKLSSSHTMLINQHSFSLWRSVTSHDTSDWNWWMNHKAVHKKRENMAFTKSNIIPSEVFLINLFVVNLESSQIVKWWKHDAHSSKTDAGTGETNRAITSKTGRWSWCQVLIPALSKADFPVHDYITGVNFHISPLFTFSDRWMASVSCGFWLTASLTSQNALL